MEKSNKLRKSLGLKQHEMALLLGINRAQWSMYESGKRRLPTQARLKLVELENQIETAKVHNKKESRKPKENAALEAHIKSLLQNKEVECERITRKLNAATRKITAEVALINVSEVLKTHLTKSKPASISANLITTRAEKASRSTSEIPLFDLQRRLAMLEYEKKYLESFLSIKRDNDTRDNDQTSLGQPKPL